MDTILPLQEETGGITLLVGQRWGRSGAGAILPPPLELPKSQVTTTDLGNDKAFGVDINIIINGLALTVISQPPSPGQGLCQGCGEVLCS